ncbi:hypothetical protein MHTCC0001_31850 [Flavobacteriaceae bacterium MHTCC 0001]
MITSAEEFKRLRTSEDLEEQKRASVELAAINVWYDVIIKFPDLKEWVIHNKSIPIELLEFLAANENPEIRSCVARKRKINDIFSRC